MEIEVGTTIRVKEDGAQNAAVRQGECGEVVAVKETAEGTVLCCKIKGKVWYFGPDDVEVVDVNLAFMGIAGNNGIDLITLGAEIGGLYPELAYDYKAEGVKRELPADTEHFAAVTENDLQMAEEIVGGALAPLFSDADEEYEDDEDESCPEEPHYHSEDGEPHLLPSVTVEDVAGDWISAIDIRELTAGDEDGPDMVLRVIYKDGKRMEAHLKEADVVALMRFFLGRFKSN